MFGLFKKRDPNFCPVPEDVRLWIEDGVLFLLGIFNEEKIKNRKILTPHINDFPITFNSDEQTAFDVLKIVSKQMEVDVNEIELEFYEDGLTEISSGHFMGQPLYLGSYEDSKESAGLYSGKQENGKYLISLERRNLLEPDNMIATLAHEIAHIKLLGENKMDDNDEELTDLTTVIFGLGIFNANTSFQTFKGFEMNGWSKAGYLKQMEWGYALALLAHIREEKDPNWISFLTPNIKVDFKQSIKFINNNLDIIFK